MIQHKIIIEMNCPVEKAFSFLAEARNLRAWQTDLVENEQLSAGPLQVGTRFRELRKTGPRLSEIEAEITSFEPPHRFATQTVRGMQARVEYTFEPVGNQTKITYLFTLRTSGLMRLLEPLLAGQIKKGNEEDLQKLRALLERPL